MLESELESVVAEYGSYFPLVRLLGQPAHTIEVETMEGEALRIKVATGGWYILSSPQLYDTFEALMNSKSRGFQTKFADHLFSRLQQLADTESN